MIQPLKSVFAAPKVLSLILLCSNVCALLPLRTFPWELSVLPAMEINGTVKVENVFNAREDKHGTVNQ